MILLLSTLLAVESLDLEMTPQEKKKTGVYKLREPEKASLKQWIDNHYEKREKPLVEKLGPVVKPSLLENLSGGHLIRLSDDSLWSIRPENTPITQGWITSVEIFIAPSKDPEYPFKLTNSLTSSSVFAKRVTTP